MAIKKTEVSDEPVVSSNEPASKHKFGKKSPFSFKSWNSRDKNYGYRYILLEEAERRTDEGFEVVLKDEIAKLKPVAGKFNEGGAWQFRDMILMRCLLSVIKERNEYYQNMWKEQISTDKNRLQEEADKNKVELTDNR